MKKLMMTIIHDTMKTIMDMIKMRKSDAPITTIVFKIFRIISLLFVVVDFYVFLSSFLYVMEGGQIFSSPPSITYKNVPCLLV